MSGQHPMNVIGRSAPALRFRKVRTHLLRKGKVNQQPVAPSSVRGTPLLEAVISTVRETVRSPDGKRLRSWSIEPTLARTFVGHLLAGFHNVQDGP